APTTTVPTEPTATSTSTAPSATTAPTSSAPEGEHTVAPWILTIGGGVLVVAGGVMLGVGSGDVSSADKTCPSHVNCDPSVASKGNTGRTLETAGVVVGGVGIAAVVGGLVWHFTEHPQASGTALAPVVAPGYAGLSLGGSF
ncbi:MAG TPA: hypothetical protein VIY73_01575, partial [Polyangiaceae bacterium]